MAVLQAGNSREKEERCSITSIEGAGVLQNDPVGRGNMNRHQTVNVNDSVSASI